jgi:tetratricopeptide (TPR) repeat protein
MTAGQGNLSRIGRLHRLANLLWVFFQEARLPGAPGRSPRRFTPASELLDRAANCYARAGLLDDACRVLHLLGNDRHAALYYEQLARWQEAADCYVRGGDWPHAAECYLRCDQTEEAAKCLLKAGQILEAAWLFADRVRKFGRAKRLLSEFHPQSDSDKLALELIRARCDASNGAPERAVKRLRIVLAGMHHPTRTLDSKRIYDWAVIIAETLRRPDLIASIHAKAAGLNLPEAYERWEIWAEKTLGDATGVPQRVRPQ